MKNHVRFALLLITIFILSISSGPAIQVPEEIEIRDAPYETGDNLLLMWPTQAGESREFEYVIYKAESPAGPWEEDKRFASDMNYAIDLDKYFYSYFGSMDELRETHAVEVTPFWEEKVKEWIRDDGTVKTKRKRIKPLETYYKLTLEKNGAVLGESEVVSGTPEAEWFRLNKLNGMIMLSLLLIFVVYFISKAQRNPNIFLRKIAGIDAVDEAVGRATEMGKPLLYSTGYYDIQEISTICSVNILGHVAKKVAQYDSRLIVPCKWPVAMTVCQEVVREAYINAGRPDAFNINDIFFVAGEQFSYTIGVDSIMVREKPAANFFMGTFAAEALILAETGATTGAIQIAGTDSNYQIPFFVVACDYCLIGEELYAASAYLARNPKLVGSLKAQDAGKLIVFAAIILGVIMITLYQFYDNIEILTILERFFTAR